MPAGTEHVAWPSACGTEEPGGADPPEEAAPCIAIEVWHCQWHGLCGVCVPTVKADALTAPLP